MMVALITWLWQGLAIAAATAGLLAGARRLSAASRHLCWWVACASVVALPAAYLLAETFTSTPVAAAVPIPAPPPGLATAALVGWTAFALVAFSRLALSVRTVHALKRSALPLDPAAVSKLAGRCPSPPAGPAILLSNEISGACALGLGRPVVLLSRSVAEDLDGDELAAVVMHERAHLERHDDWWQLLDAVVFAVIGWHPAVWMIGRRIALEREAACDDVASVAGQDVVAYARALVRVAAGQAAARRRLTLAAAPAAAGSPSLLRRRIERLFDPRLGRGRRVPRYVAIAAAAITTVAIGASARMPTVVTVVDAVTQLPRVSAPWTYVGGAGPAAILPADIPLVRRTPVAVDSGPPAARERDRAVVRTALPDSLPALDPPRVAGASGAPLTPLDSTPTAAAVEANVPLLPTATMPSAWGSFGRSAASAGLTLGRTGAATGDRARDAGVSIGRFFSRAAKAVAAGV